MQHTFSDTPLQKHAVMTEIGSVQSHTAMTHTVSGKYCVHPLSAALLGQPMQQQAY